MKKNNLFQNARRVLCVAMTLMVAAPMVQTKAATTYTYNYDFFEDERESPDAYSPTYSVTGKALGTTDFNAPQSLFANGNDLYVVDTNNNRIVLLQAKEDGSLVFVNEITTFMNNGAEDTFNKPNDIFVNKNGDYFICDTDNNRIVQLNPNLELVMEYTKPFDETFDQALPFLPAKAVVDDSGRVLCIANNVNKGVMQYAADGHFFGYIGASEVTFSMIDYLWKKIASQAQKAQMANFVPTEYNNMCMDADGFLYVITQNFDQWDLLSDKAKPIRKLNSMGADILIKNGYFPPIGDVDWDTAAGVGGPSKFADITALENDTYYAVDKTRGRIFGYDSQGNLLYAFGGIGNKLGSFILPSALEHIGTDLYVLDNRTNSITKFVLTEYGEEINKALADYKTGNYDGSADHWREVLRQNGNYDLAYIGIGRALLRQDRYEEAMECFELKYDKKNYSKAYKLWRKEWIEEHIGGFVIILLALIIIPAAIRKGKQIKREAMEE